MTYDISVKVKDLGEVYGSYLKSTTNSVYLRNALINKANGVTVSLFKIEKKYIISISRMAIPSFDSFTNAQLTQIINLNVPDYTAAAQKVISSRQIKNGEFQENPKQSEGNKKAIKEKKDQKSWNQFSANKEMFGVDPKFSMDEYADTIDRNAPGYKELKAMSDKLAKEILSQSTTDIHRQEERHQYTQSAVSDDQLYSTVQSVSKWDSALEKKKFEKQNNETAKAQTESVKASNDTQKLSQEVRKDLPTDIKKNTDNEPDLAKEHENFKNGGWSSVVQFLSEKAKKENALQAELKTATDSLSASPSSTSRDKSPKPHSEIFSKSSPNINSDVNRHPRNKDKRSNSGNRKGVERSALNDGKVSKPINLVSPIKFSSADSCIKHVVQNFKNHSHDNSRQTWGSNSGLLMSGLLLPHLSPLTENIFSPEKLDEIKSAIAQSKTSISLHKN